MKSKLKFIIPLALLIAGGAYKLVLAKPGPAAKPKIAGEVYVLPKDFLINLADGRFAKLGVALVFDEGYTPSGGGHAEAGALPPDGYGTLPQEAVVRDIVNDTITDASARSLVSRDGRRKLKLRILRRIDKETDVKVKDVLFTDVAVQ